MGSRIAWSGAGINLKTGSPAPEELRRAVMEVLRNPSYRQNARAIQADFDRYDSPSQAAELLERLVKTKAPVTRAQ